MLAERRELLRAANREFRAFLAQAAAEALPNREQIQNLLCRLEQVKQMLAQEPLPRPIPWRDREILEYVENLEKLKPALEETRLRLLAHRAHLQRVRAHLAAASAWAASCRQVRLTLPDT